MATMYSLFLGVFLAAVCSPLGTGSGAVVWRDARCEVRDARCEVRDAGSSLSRKAPIAGACLPDRQAGLPTRAHIITIANAELGIREATGNNDGPRVEEYLRYTGLGKGHAWCAAFVSWCFGQAGRSEPRNPWSPALFPNAKIYWRHNTPPLGVGGIQPADLFGIYGASAKRINHVGLVRKMESKYLITIEGNSNNRVESRRRHLSTIYALADWL